MSTRWIIAVLLAAAGCDEPTETTASTATGQTGTSTGAAGGAGGMGGVGGGALSLEGVLIDTAEMPLGGVDVLACMTTVCFTQESLADGRFAFAIEGPAEIALKTQANLAVAPRRAAALEPVRLAMGSAVDAGTLYVPDLPDGAVMAPATEDPQTLSAGDGVELTLSRGDLEPLLGEVLHDVAARRLPQEHVPVYADLEGEEIVAVFALHPFGAVSASPISVRATADVPDATPVLFRTISEIDGAFSEPVAGAAEGGSVATAAGTGITHLTYLVISR